MEVTLQERLEKLLNAYSHQYDIERDVTVDGGTFPAVALFYLRDENYLISKKHVLSAVENYGYTYFFLTEHLTKEELQQQIDISRNDALSRVKPNKEHMSTTASLVILANSIDAEAKKLIRKTRFRKYYRLALHGWMEYHISAMEVSTNSFLSNPAGREARKTLEKNFKSRGSKKGATNK